jgi:SAM-dependent methyltransferase
MAHRDDHAHGDSAHHDHGNEQDRGLKGMLRYLGHARSMWRSDVNEAVVARLAPAPGERVVDIGAGAGAGTVVAARRGAHVVAVEPTGYMRRVLGLRRLAQRARARIDVVDGAAESTGLDAGSVDAVWAVNSMHHWTDPDAAIRELARILRPGGRLVLADEDFDDPTHPDHEAFSERHADHSHHFEMVDPQSIAADLRAVGLDVTSAGKEPVAGAPTLLIEATVPLD